MVFMMKKIGKFLKKQFINLRNDSYIELLVILFFSLSFSFNPAVEVLDGYVKILLSPSNLLTDYIFISSIGSAFLNAGFNLLIHLISIKLLKVRVNSPIFAGLMMVTGFSFFGKNIINTIPILFGVFLFTRFKHVSFRSQIIVSLFSTGIAPLVSYIMFGFDMALYISIPVGILVGIMAGFILPQITVHTMRFHEGYTIYNTGFALGVIGIISYALLSLFNLRVERQSFYDLENHMVLYYVLFAMFVFLILMAFIGNRKVLSNYRRLLKTSGRLISYYFTDFGIEAVILNIGCVGLALTTILFLFKIPLNGILFGSVIAVIGCAAFGIHLLNSLPVIIGAILAFVIRLLILQRYLDPAEDFSYIVGFIFSLGLSPIAGKYGFIYGIIAGITHIAISPLMSVIHGGLVLYNNGFATGFEAMILVVCAEHIFNREKKHGRKQENK